MPKGGHAHSGPPRDPNSRTSERRGFTPTTLLAAGFAGEAPNLADYLPAATERHEEIWALLWRTPQACMWDREPWRIPNVVDLVRCQVRAEDPEAPAAWETAIQQKRTEAGLTEAGLRFNGWAVSQDELAAKRDEQPADAPKRERRLRSADAQ